MNTYLYLPKNLKFAALKPLNSNKYLTCFSRISLLNYSHQKLNLGAWSAALLFAFRLPFGHENIFPARERIILSFAFALLKFFFFPFSFIFEGWKGGVFRFPIAFPPASVLPLCFRAFLPRRLGRCFPLAAFKIPNPIPRLLLTAARVALDQPSRSCEASLGSFFGLSNSAQIELTSRYRLEKKKTKKTEKKK